MTHKESNLGAGDASDNNDAGRVGDVGDVGDASARIVMANGEIIAMKENAYDNSLSQENLTDFKQNVEVHQRHNATRSFCLDQTLDLDNMDNNMDTNYNDDNLEQLDELPKISNVRSYIVCEICERPFSSSIYLSRHYSYHFKDELFNDLHDKMPPFKCPVSGCSFQTKHRFSWLRHYGVTHGRNEKYLDEYRQKTDDHSKEIKIQFTKGRQKKSTRQTWSCDLCGQLFIGPQRMSSKLRHYSSVHFKNKLLADLKDKNNPPYLCPILSCSFQTEDIQSWTRHYGVFHNQIQKYLNPLCLKNDKDECVLAKINNLGFKSQKIKDECTEELRQLTYLVSPSQQLSGEKGLQEPTTFVLNFNDSIIENEKLDFIHFENDEDLDTIDSFLPWL